jgi:hypothetical protein
MKLVVGKCGGKRPIVCGRSTIGDSLTKSVRLCAHALGVSRQAACCQAGRAHPFDHGVLAHLAAEQHVTADSEKEEKRIEGKKSNERSK